MVFVSGGALVTWFASGLQRQERKKYVDSALIQKVDMATVLKLMLIVFSDE